VLAAYRVLAHLGHRLPAPAALRSVLGARRGAADRWIAWARHAPGAGPLVWAHAASVGEQQVLEPVLSRLVRRCPDLRIVLTHTSPSVLRTKPPAAVCHRDYLPWDTPGPITAVLDVLRPALLLFGRGDLWPELVSAAAARKIPIAVAGATVRSSSVRLGTFPRLALRAVYRHVTWLGAVTPGDAQRWGRMGVVPERISVTGDPRHDRILERIPDLAPASRVRAWAGDGPVCVAGSVEPGDDAVLTGALVRLATEVPALRTVVVPHDAAEPRITQIVRRMAEHGLAAGIWRGPDAGAPPESPIVVVAGSGLLADLYLGADIAYVGGGFRRGRLHAVAEPAAVGLPVIVGPRWEGAADAGPMVGAGGAIPVRHDGGRGFAEVVRRLAGDPDERTHRGHAARSVLADGAAQATAEALGVLL
jgi:3-deoxy-D-manno-octulosonic-acid transferase